MASVKLLLKESIKNVGRVGDVVEVSSGYARNYLLPKKLAVEATKANKAVIEQMKAASVRRSAKEKHEAEALAKQFEGVKLSFHRKAGEHDVDEVEVARQRVAEPVAAGGGRSARKRPRTR